jgi:hypothetical protein
MTNATNAIPTATNYTNEVHGYALREWGARNPSLAVQIALVQDVAHNYCLDTRQDMTGDIHTEVAAAVLALLG